MADYSYQHAIPPHERLLCSEYLSTVAACFLQGHIKATGTDALAARLAAAGLLRRQRGRFGGGGHREAIRNILLVVLRGHGCSCKIGCAAVVHRATSSVGVIVRFAVVLRSVVA